MTVKVFAPAKINLTLHVTGQRDDGYHLLDSLVMFAGVGDVLTIAPASLNALTVSGPEARGVPVDANNLVMQVASKLWQGHPLGIHLEKSLPAEAGIGGGSADAAACFRGLAFLLERIDSAFDLDQFTDMAMRELLDIGADIPMCMASKPARICGIGDQINLLDDAPQLAILLVNPRVSVPTPSVFAALKKRSNPAMTEMPSDMSNTSAFVGWLAEQRNDLEPAAISQAPIIATVLEQVRQTTGCLLARMSGSGATCFGLYPSLTAAKLAAQQVVEAHSDWWVKPTTLLNGEDAAPQLIRATT